VNEFHFNLLLGFVAKFYCEVLSGVKLVFPILGKKIVSDLFKKKTGSITAKWNKILRATGVSGLRPEQPTV